MTKPQITRITAELLQLSVSQLVLLLQRHALPWLVLTKRREVVQKIAEFRGEREAWRPCVDNANLSAILALLLAQDIPPAQIEPFTMSLLRYISPHFNGSSLVDLLRVETIQTILELLKVSGEAGEARRSRVSIPHPAKKKYHLQYDLISFQIRGAFVTVATLLLDSKEEKGRKNIIGCFLQQHALGITARLAEVINDSVVRQPPIQEQRRCIRALEEMIRLCESYIRIARPPVRGSKPGIGGQC